MFKETGINRIHPGKRQTWENPDKKRKEKECLSPENSTC